MAGREDLPTYPGWDTVRKIGTGSFGSVYEIERDLFGTKERAALKLITIPQHESDVEELYSNGYDDASITAHFKNYLVDIAREYQFMAEMKGHTNVVYCDDIRFVQHDNGFGWDIFIKMELLTSLIKAPEKVASEEQVVKLGQDICRALALCRGRNILHRDIKPQNIFVSKDGDFKLGDFGIAKTVERTSGGTKIGTYNYMAPEVYNNAPYGHAADIYSLGLVLYWLLNEHRMPFTPLSPAVPKASEMDSARLRRFRGEPLPAPVRGGGELQRVVLRACAYDPQDRYQSAEEMRKDLEKLSMHLRTVSTPVCTQERISVPAENTTDEVLAPGESLSKQEFDQTIGAFGDEKRENSTQEENFNETVGVFGGGVTPQRAGKSVEINRNSRKSEASRSTSTRGRTTKPTSAELLEKWECECGYRGTGSFCLNCYRPKPRAAASICIPITASVPQAKVSRYSNNRSEQIGTWVCLCGYQNSGDHRFCERCDRPNRRV